jgi:CheY-like chemotaxis protein/anti-sigma regulatory factor (Ser/Thr protein kinase)
MTPLDMKCTDVLIVEKDSATRATLCNTLSRTGWSVACACNEDEALERLTTNTFKVALLDASLSDRYNLEALRHRLHEMTPPGVVVMIGVNTAEGVLGALKTVYDFVSTPIQADQLQEVIHRAVGGNAASSSIEVLYASRQWLELLVPCTRDAAERCQHFLNALELDLEMVAREAVLLAFRELVLNAVEWGGRLDPTRCVRVVRIRGRGTLAYRITDPGPGFQPDDLLHAAIGQRGDDAIGHMQVRNQLGIRAGGFGLVIVRALADELIYNDRGNEVTFVKYFADETSC